MKAGRELDCIVAEKVMGYKLRTVRTFYSGDRFLPETHKYIGDWIKDGDDYQPSDIPEYSTNIAAAWSVVEKLRPRFGFMLTDWPDQEPGKYEASFAMRNNIGEGFPLYEAEVDTVPLAICLAALKAVGVDI